MTVDELKHELSDCCYDRINETFKMSVGWVLQQVAEYILEHYELTRKK